MTREDELLEQLRAIHIELQERAKPIIDELVAIRSLRPLPPIIIVPEMVGKQARSIIETHLGMELLGPLGGDY